MGISVQAENVEDALQKMGVSRHRNGVITIHWRQGESYDYQPGAETGCIVDAVGCPGEDVKRSFESSAEALRYIGKFLKMHDEHSRKLKAERKKKLREYEKTKRKHDASGR